MSRSKIYFPSLNGLRFIAAFMVIVHHIEQFKSIYKLDNHWDNKAVALSGKLGVVLFFVLSGFLITYLLLTEKEKTTTISVKDFYIRRILRIWPLYFLIVILALFVLPYIGIFQLPSGSFTVEAVHSNLLYKVLLFVFLMPNMVLVMFGAIPFAAPTWSIGVEEQFYFIWPNLIKKIKRPVWAFVFVIVAYYSIKFALPKLGSSDELIILSRFWNTFSIQLMSIGAIGAFLVYTRSSLLKIIYNKYIQIVAYLITIAMIVTGFKLSHFTYELYALFFAVIILNLATNKKSVISLENKVFDFLGKISYGLYLYHGICIVLTINILLKFGIYNNIVVYITSIVLTIVTAYLSYRYFERFFLKFKNKFTIVKSGK